MKKIEMLAIIAIILYIIAELFQTVGHWFIMPLLAYFNWSFQSVALLSVPLMIVIMLVNIAIAIWIFIVAKRYQNIPWVWALFGLTGGLLAPLLFYAMRIYETLNRNKETSEP
jgi:hypothetical protein